MAAPVFMRGVQGLWSIDGTKYSSEPIAEIDKSNSCKSMTFSEDGSLFAWCNADSAYIMDANTMEILQDLGLPKLVELKFSPKGSVLASWNNYMVNRDGGAGMPNLHLFDVKTGDIKKSYIQKKQMNWNPEWSGDEGICVRNVNNELQFYESNNFDQVANKLHLQKVSGFSLAKGSSPYSIAAYVPGAKGQPSFVRIYRYPHLSGLQAALASKSFFKADRVNFFWNKTGHSLLVLTSTESSDSSYYGEQGLHYLNVNGDSCLVPLQKQGPIYHLEWLPNQQEFVLVHGCILFALCAVKTFPEQKKQIAQTQATDTTHFEWCPDGQHLLTCTTAPRLRVGNGYRIWHYTGTLMLQKFTENHAELWEVHWRPRPCDEAPKFSISSSPVASGAAVEQPKAKAGAYRPPHARGTPGAPAPTQRPLQEYEPPSNAKESDKAPSKNKKKREARKAKAAQEAQAEAGAASTPAQPTPSSNSSASEVKVESTGDPEKDKKLRNLRKKVQQIEKLKEQQAAGKTMEKNQVCAATALSILLDHQDPFEVN
ncbi:eukaryotic translation initiation factor 2a [Plakobranchus ocellatus]|uniref:Eukaryotic translation initiation factor 2A n=1 Tax=Plakobranchus ocellatus TaxID=259542 RepID=A0AAV4ATR1_9GAST|nr:eukaryotic translation initiation factor 2a [Plakobranchus ocellatus]